MQSLEDIDNEIKVLEEKKILLSKQKQLNDLRKEVKKLNSEVNPTIIDIIRKRREI